MLESSNGGINDKKKENLYELMHNLVPLLMNKIKIIKNFDAKWNRMVYRGELMVVEDE